MKSLFLIVTLLFSSLSFANKELVERLREQMKNPNMTEEQRAEFPKFIDAAEKSTKIGDDYDASIKPDQEFKSGKEWNKYFRFKFPRMTKELGEKEAAELKTKRARRDQADKNFDDAGDKLNQKYVKELLTTGLMN